MKNDDPRYKLIKLIEDEVKSGASDSDVLKKMVMSGFEEEHAKKVLIEVKKMNDSHNNHKRQVATFFLKGIILAVVIFLLIFYFLGKDTLIGLTWSLFGLFLASWVVLLALGNLSGKEIAKARCVLSSVTFLSTVLLCGTLFLHSEWEPLETANSGSWRYQLLKVSAKLVYFIGPVGFAIVLVIVSFFALLLCWAEWYKFKNQNYGKM